MSIILLILAAGVPYYLILEKSKKLNNEKIFLISGFLLLCAIVLACVSGMHSLPASRTSIVPKCAKVVNVYPDRN